MEKGKEKEKVDTRTLPREVLEEKRRMAIRLREELNLTWKEIARPVAGASDDGTELVQALSAGRRGGAEGPASGAGQGRGQAAQPGAGKPDPGGAAAR